jgi:hypothetical protein
VKTVWTIGVAILIFAGSGSAQSIYGPGGLLLNPTADLPPVGQLTPAVLVLPQESDAIGGWRTWTSVILDYGLAERWEVGAIYLDASGFPEGRDGSIGAFGKYQILPGSQRSPAVAVGAGFLTGGDLNGQTLFLAARQELSRPGSAHPLRLHAGVFYADELNGTERDDLVPYVGLEYGLSRTMRLFGEWRSEMRGDIEPVAAVGVLLRPGDRYHVALALANNGRSDGLRFSIGVGYTIRSGRGRARAPDRPPPPPDRRG